MTGIALRFFACTAALPLAALLLPGVESAGPEDAWIAGGLLAFVYLVLRPVLRLLVSAGNCLSLGLLGFAVDAGLVWGIAQVFPGVRYESFPWALAAAGIVTVLRGGADVLAGKLKDMRRRR